MKILLLNGSPHERGCTATALAELAGSLEQRGVETETLHVGVKPVADCTACGVCAECGICVFDDAVNDILENLDDYGGIVVGSPVYYAGPTGAVTSFLNRLFYAGGRRMAGKLGAAVVSCRRAGATAALDRLYKYFTISNMVLVGSQYWPMVHGVTPDQVRADAEGLQIMRTLGENMAWLLREQQAGREAAVAPAVYEPRVTTSFHH
ncbi:MAG: flavodoxin family protein [Bacillota bacterium]|nr:flavodoxin family protein [Bacillota bacterium]